MARQITLRVADEVASVVLFEDKAPKTCARLLESLPLHSSAIVAKVAGLELMLRVPFFLDSGGENEVTAQQAGNVCFVPGAQNLCVFCEDLPGLAACSLIGRITTNLAGIQAEARKCRKRQGAEVRIYEPQALQGTRARKGTKALDGPREAGQTGASFVARLRARRERMWTETPREIRDALDKSKGRTDSWGSSFFPTLYAWEETVASRNAFLTLRSALMQPDTDLGTLKLISRQFLELYVSYFGMTNLPDTTGLLREAAAEVMGLDSREQLRELLEELVRYCGRLHYWIEPLMPWEDIIRAFESSAD